MEIIKNKMIMLAAAVCFVYLLLILTAISVYPQAKNTISSDGTTENCWYVGSDSSAKLGVGIPQDEPISNMLTVRDSGTAGSQTFISGWMSGSGWKLEPDSSLKYRLTVDDITVRGTMSVYQLLLNQVRATNGNLLVTSSAVVDSVDRNRESFWTVDVTGMNNAPFMPGDIILCQGADISGASFDESGNISDNNYLVKRLVFVVTAVSGRRVYVGIPAGAPLHKSNIKKGDVFCRIGNTGDADRMGLIGLFSDEAHSPYLRVTDSVQSWSDWSDSKSTKVQLGRLTGINDPDFGGHLEGYGLYANNAYIKGKIIVTNPSDFSIDMAWDSISNKPAYFNAPAGKGLFISADNMGYYNGSDYPSEPWRTYMDNEGRLYLKGRGEHYLSWNDSILTIKGNIILANTIPVQSVTGLGNLAYKDVLGIDEIPDGTLYARVLKTDIQSGHIKLSEALGTIDDIKNGTYAKVLSTEINAGHIKITGSDGSTTVIDGGKIKAGSIKGSEIAAGTVLTSNLSFTPVQNTNVVASINASQEGLKISGNKITIDGTVTFADGYDIAGKLEQGAAAEDINSGTTTISGSKITTGTITANKLNVGQISSISADLGTITAGTINASTVNVTNINADNIKYGTISADRIGSRSITSDKIATGTITAENIASGAITTEKLTAGTLTGFTIQTANTGQRVVIDGSTNRIMFYNSSGNNAGSIYGYFTGLIPVIYVSGYGVWDGSFSVKTDLDISGAFYSGNISGGYGFSINTEGNIIRINNIPTSFPSSQGGNNTYLKNDGNGNLSWSPISAANNSTTTSLWVASTIGGAATTQLKTRTINIAGVNFSVLVNQ